MAPSALRKSAIRKSALRPSATRPAVKRKSAPYMAAWRLRNPMKCRFDWVRSSARKRGVPFLLTFEQFSAWAVAVDYLNLCGLHKFHCDRIDAAKGYEVGNLQLLHCRENWAKAARERGLRRKANAL